MKWPRGRYNGRRIGGFEIRFAVNVFDWIWTPWFSGFIGKASKRLKCPLCIGWLCFFVTIQLEFDEYEVRRN